MSRRPLSTSPSPAPDARPPKRQRLDHLTKDDFKGHTFLAPMVRSGTCMSTAHKVEYTTDFCIVLVLTRLYALKYGASLVWGPEMVDKAMLHAERVVDRKLMVIPIKYTLRAVT